MNTYLYYFANLSLFLTHHSSFFQHHRKTELRADDERANIGATNSPGIIQIWLGKIAIKDFIVGSGKVGPKELLSKTHDPHPFRATFFIGVGTP